MRKIVFTFLLALIVGGVLFPASVFARRVAVFGSLLIERCTNDACTTTEGLTTQFNGVTFLANPGLEKTIASQIPPFWFPVFVNTDTDGPGGGDLDTTLVLVNVSGSSQKIKLTLRDSDGNTVALTTDVFTVDINHTLSLSISNLLP